MTAIISNATELKRKNKQYLQRLFLNQFNLLKKRMQELFYNVAYTVHENGASKINRSCLLRSARLPTLDAARDHIRHYFLKDSTALITLSQVTSISKEVYLRLGGDPNAPLVKVDK